MAENIDLEYILFYSSIPFLVFGLIGNALVIRIVHKKRAEMHTPTNYLLVIVAVSDVVTSFLWFLYFFEFEHSAICKLAAIIEISIMISSITLTVLAVERYHAVLKPFRAGMRLNKHNVKKAISFILIASVIICFPEFLLKEWNKSNGECIGPWTLNMNQASKVYIMFNTSVTCVQLAIVFFCYGCLIRGLYFSNNRVYPETQRDTTSEKKKLVITFILATTGFFVGYMPTILLYTFVAASDDKLLDSRLRSDLVGVVDFMFVCCLCINPIIYSFRSRKFQEELKRIIFCRTPQNASQTFDYTL